MASATQILVNRRFVNDIELSQIFRITTLGISHIDRRFVNDIQLSQIFGMTTLIVLYDVCVHDLHLR